MEFSKEIKQKNLFASICHLADESKEVEAISGGNTKK